MSKSLGVWCLTAAAWLGPLYGVRAQAPADGIFLVREIQRTTNDQVVVTFPADAEHLYEVLVVTNLQGQITPRISPPLLGQAQLISWTELAPPVSEARFYRARRLAFDDDADNDALTNLEEFQLGTDLHAADSDGDGLPDGWEVKYHLNPRSADGDDGGTGDPDGDRVSNLTEYRQHRNPRAGAVADSSGATGLEVFTPFE